MWAWASLTSRRNAAASNLRIVFFQPGHLANRLVAHFAQSPDQLSGLCGIAFTHRGIVAPAGVPGRHIESARHRRERWRPDYLFRRGLGRSGSPVVRPTARQSVRRGAHGARLDLLWWRNGQFAAARETGPNTVRTALRQLGRGLGRSCSRRRVPSTPYRGSS